MNIGQIIVWVIVGALAGNIAGWMVTFKKEGLGRWTNLGVGMAGAVIGGFVFNLFDVDLGLGELKVTFEDLAAAIAGSLFCVLLWWVVRRTALKKAEAQLEE